MKLLFVDLLNEKLKDMDMKTAKIAAQFLITEFKKEKKIFKKLKESVGELEIDADVGESFNVSLRIIGR